MKFRNKDFNILYAQLLSQLASIGVHNINDYYNLRSFKDNKRLKKIELSFVKNLSNLKNNLGKIINDTQGISILVKEMMPQLLRSHLNKFLVFSEFAAIQAEGIKAVDENEIELEMGTMKINYISGPNIHGCLKLAYDNLAEVKKGVIFPIPKETETLNLKSFKHVVDKYNEKYDYYYEKPDLYYKHYYEYFYNKFGNRLDANIQTREALFDNFELVPFQDNRVFDEAKHFAFQKAKISFQMPSKSFLLSLNGDAISKNSNFMKLGFMLPSLENIPTSVVRKIRQDYHDDFLLFQNSLVKISKQFAEETDENRFVLMIKEVDTEVRKLHKTFESIKKTHKSLNIFMSLVSIVLYLSVKNPELMKHFNTVFSGIGTAFFIEYFRDIRDSKSKIENNPFYFPLRLHESLR